MCIFLKIVIVVYHWHEADEHIKYVFCFQNYGDLRYEIMKT